MSSRKANLRPVRELQSTLQFRTIHGYRRAYRIAGEGPAILLIHGIGDVLPRARTMNIGLVVGCGEHGRDELRSGSQCGGGACMTVDDVKNMVHIEGA